MPKTRIEIRVGLQPSRGLGRFGPVARIDRGNVEPVRTQEVGQDQERQDRGPPRRRAGSGQPRGTRAIHQASTARSPVRTVADDQLAAQPAIAVEMVRRGPRLRLSPDRGIDIDHDRDRERDEHAGQDQPAAERHDAGPPEPLDADGRQRGHPQRNPQMEPHRLARAAQDRQLDGA